MGSTEDEFGGGGGNTEPNTSKTQGQTSKLSNNVD